MKSQNNNSKSNFFKKYLLKFADFSILKLLINQVSTFQYPINSLTMNLALSVKNL